LNLSVESDVDLSRPVTVHLKQATFAEAMDMLVKNGAGYAWTVEGEVLFIKTFMERIYAFDYLDMPGERRTSRWAGTCWPPASKTSGVSGKYVLKTKKSEKTTDVWLGHRRDPDHAENRRWHHSTVNRNGGLIYMADTPKQVAAMVRFLDAMSEALNQPGVHRSQDHGSPIER
jgi:hypothetical protein